MSLTLRLYQPSDATVITSWLKKLNTLCANGVPIGMSIILSRPKIWTDALEIHWRTTFTRLTMVDGCDIVGYITLRIPADDPAEQRLGFVIVDEILGVVAV